MHRRIIIRGCVRRSVKPSLRRVLGASYAVCTASFLSNIHDNLKLELDQDQQQSPDTSNDAVLQLYDPYVTEITDQCFIVSRGSPQSLGVYVSVCRVDQGANWVKVGLNVYASRNHDEKRFSGCRSVQIKFHTMYARFPSFSFFRFCLFLFLWLSVSASLAVFIPDAPVTLVKWKDDFKQMSVNCIYKRNKFNGNK